MNYDFNSSGDISLPLRDARAEKGATAWYVNGVKFEPVRGEGFVGRVNEGGSVNFTDVYFNPHGHGTHTECMGHITPEMHSIDGVIRSGGIPPILECMVHTVDPQKSGDDYIITPGSLPTEKELPAAFIIRTLPNPESKKVKAWDNTNPPYLDHEFTRALVERGVEHLLIDLPSVDREVDGGALVSHRVFFGIPHSPRKNATITEFVYVPNRIEDGTYGLNLQVAPFDLDASPSRPVLYPLA